MCRSFVGRQGVCPTPPWTTYRSKRDPARTPEPVPPPGPLPDGRRTTPSSSRSTTRGACTGTSGSSATACWCRGRSPRACRWTRRPTTSPCTPRTTRWSTPAFEGDIAAGRVRRRPGAHLGPRHVRDREVDRPRGQGRPARRPGRRPLRAVPGPAGKNWMVHRMDPPPAGFEPLPRAGAPDDGGACARRCRRDDDAVGVRDEVGRRPRRRLRRRRPGASAVPQRPRHHARTPSCASWPSRSARGQVVLDGEIVALDARGRPELRAAAAAHARRERHAGPAAGASTPVTFMVFDVLHLDGRSTAGPALRRAARLLESLQLHGPLVADAAGVVRRRRRCVLAAAREQGLEGVVAKRLDSPYRPGRRSTDWLKVKHLRTQEVVIGGWKPGAGRRRRHDRLAAARRAGRRRARATPATSARASPSRRSRPGARLRAAAPGRRRRSPATCRASRRPRRALGRARGRGRGALRRVDAGRAAASSRWRGLRPDKAPQTSSARMCGTPDPTAAGVLQPLGRCWRPTASAPSKVKS